MGLGHEGGVAGRGWMEGRRERSRFNDGFLTACTAYSDTVCMQLETISDKKLACLAFAKLIWKKQTRKAGRG